MFFYPESRNLLDVKKLKLNRLIDLVNKKNKKSLLIVFAVFFWVSTEWKYASDRHFAIKPQ